MSWCPFCVWKRLGEDGQAALSSLPSRLAPPMRNLFNHEDLIELGRRTPEGTIWAASPRGRAVLRAADELSESAEGELGHGDE